MPIENAISEGRQLRLLLMAFLFFANYAKFLSNSFLFGGNGNIAVGILAVIFQQGFLVHAGCKVVGSQGAGNVVPYAEDSPRDCRSCTDVGRILRTFKIKKNVEVTDNGKIII